LENFVVELEGTDGTIDIMEAVRRSANYIRSSNFVKAAYSKRYTPFPDEHRKPVAIRQAFYVQ
jgi:hypothetical protein